MKKMAMAGYVVGMVLLGARVSGGQEPFNSVELVSGTEHEGQTSPMVGMPFAMTQWTPETKNTEKKCVAPYYYADETITGFRGSHWLSGSCALEYGSFTLMPVTGGIDASAAGRASKFKHESEVMNPAYYAVTLDRYAERVELTGTVRTGIMRITFPEKQAGSVVMQPNSWKGEGFVEVHADKREIVGYNPVHRFFRAKDTLAGFSGYFVARFSEPFAAHGTYCGKDVKAGVDVQSAGCDGLGGYATFAAGKKMVLVKIGTSFTSLEEAAKNLDAEQTGWDFEGVRAKTEAVWKARLSQIEVEGGTADERKTFYTAVYHEALAPRVANDADGTYNGFSNEGKLEHIEGADYYDDYSMWDTFRALHPMFTIIDPEREQQMVQSLILKGEQGGFLPIFPLYNSYTSAMTGDHPGAVIADAYAKGLTHFDAKEGYRLMLQNATVTPSTEEYVFGKGRRALPSYIKYGYVPLEELIPEAFHRQEQVTRTVEYAFDDAMVAIMAKSFGTPEEVAAMQKRSENWRNVLDPSVGFMRGRHADGTWLTPYDPAKKDKSVTEGVPWQYTFFAPQNIPGLIEAVGGRKIFVEKLDGLFAHDLYEQGNEPSHHIAYLYDYAGAASRTQYEVRKILTQYNPGPAGLPGNDDAGQMSAWYIFSALGFYPVTPGLPFYTIGSPLFSKATIHLPNGKTFVIEAKNQSASNVYVQSQMLNGKAFPHFLLPHADIMRGGRLVFEMGSKPGKAQFSTDQPKP